MAIVKLIVEFEDVDNSDFNMTDEEIKDILHRIDTLCNRLGYSVITDYCRISD